MSSTRARLAPRFEASTTVDVQAMEVAGTIAAHGAEFFPQYLTFQVDDLALDYNVVFHVQTTKNGSQLVGLQLAPKSQQTFDSVEFPSVQDVSRQLKPDRFIGAVVAAVAFDQGIPYPNHADAEWSDHVLAKLQEARTLAETYKPRPYRRRRGALLQEVADVYIKAWENGEHPTRAVQSTVQGGHNGYSTASAWVKQAREAGLIPPATKGRAGWEDEA